MEDFKEEKEIKIGEVIKETPREWDSEKPEIEKKDTEKGDSEVPKIETFSTPSPEIKDFHIKEDKKEIDQEIEKILAKGEEKGLESIVKEAKRRDFLRLDKLHDKLVMGGLYKKFLEKIKKKK